jgi:hypothetical protein
MKTQRAMVWFWVQLAIVLLFACAGFTLGKGADSKPPWFLLVFVFLYLVLSTPWQLRWARRHDPPTGDDWFAPSWFRRPFDGPLQTFFLGSRAFIAFGICGLLRAAFAGGDYVAAGFALTTGLGLYIGLWWYLQTTGRPQTSQNT